MNSDEGPVEYRFVLYINGENPSGQRALQNLQDICEKYIANKYSIDVIDWKIAPDMMMKDGVLAVPMVIKKSPSPELRIIGDLSNRDLAVRTLGIDENVAGRTGGKA